MANIAIGERFPAFILPDDQGEPFDVRSELIGGPLMFDFYRGDWWAYCNGQLVSFARDYEEFEDRGVRIAGISVDPPSRNAAMVDKLDLPFHLLSDPRGELIKHCGLWNDEEGVSEPAIVALDKSGRVQYLYSGGTDFADRPQEESLLYILDKVGAENDEEYGVDEPEIQSSAEEAENKTVRPDKTTITLEQLKPYYRGVSILPNWHARVFRGFGMYRWPWSPGVGIMVAAGSCAPGISPTGGIHKRRSRPATEQDHGVPAHQMRILRRMGVSFLEEPLTSTGLIVDALIGYGLSGDPKGRSAELID